MLGIINKLSETCIFDFIYYTIYVLCSYPTKMCIKTASYLHKESAIQALNMVLFYALVLLLLTKFVPNSNFRRYCFCNIFFNFDANSAPNLMQKKVHNLHHSGKFMQISCQKCAGTNMHKYLVG